MTKKCDKDEEKLPKYLERREARYYVRLVAPTAMHQFLDEKERVFRKTTGTGDLKRAKVIAAEMVAQKQREWLMLSEAMQRNESSKKVSLTESLIRQIVGARLQSWIETDDEERYKSSGLDDEQLAEVEAFCQYSDRKMRSILAQGKASTAWPDVVEDLLDWCETLGYEVDLSDAHFPQLMRAYASAERKAQQFINARNSGEDPPKEDILPKTGTRLSEMVKKFEKHKRGAVARKTISKGVYIWRCLIDFKGDVFLDEVTSRDIYAFFDNRLNAKKKPWSQSYVEKHVRQTLNQFFLLAETMNLMQGHGPMGELKMTPKLPKEVEKARHKPRFPFSDEQINILFSSSWYDPNSKEFRGKMTTDLGARYFGPLIGLLHGIRVTECMQLLVSDVYILDGVLCIIFKTEIEDEDAAEINNVKAAPADGLPTRTVKNENVLRTIPAHPKLIELGFDSYVLQRRKQSGKEAPLFPSAVPNAGGKTPQWGRALQQSFLRHVRDKLYFGNGFGYHSFRHQFEDRIRDAQAKAIWPAGLGQLLSGRKFPRDIDLKFFRVEGSERYYGKGYKVIAVLKYQKRLSFDNINFPLPFNEWLKLRKD